MADWCLVELTDDDRVVIYGMLVEAAVRLRSDDREQQLLLWRRRGKRAFDDGSARSPQGERPTQKHPFPSL